MARTWSRPLFQVSYPGPETTIHVRRSLAAMDRSNPALLKMVEACRKAGLKVESPFHLTDCVAHIGIPSKKIAIFMRQSTDLALFARVQAAWEKHGWRVFITTTRQIDPESVEALAENIKRELKAVK